jgi:cell division protein FtsB
MKIKLFIFSFILTTLWGCTSSRKVVEFQNKVENLEKEIVKLQYENKELGSFRASLDEQLKKYPSVYVKICQTDEVVLDSVVLKYNRLLQNYNQLQSSYKSLKENSEMDKMNLEKVILNLQHKNIDKLNKKLSKHN